MPEQNKNQTKPITPASHWEEIYQKKDTTCRLAFQKWSYPVQAELANHLGSFTQNRSSRFIEFGCAPGRFLVYFSQVFGWEVAGVELSQTGVVRTEALLKANEVNARLYTGDMLTLEPDCQYDVVGSFGLIEHFDNPLPCYRAMMRWLRPGGAMIVTVPNLIGPIGAAMRWRNFQEYQGHQRFSPEDLANHCRAVGLRPVFWGLVGNLYIPYIYGTVNSTRIQRLANLPSRSINGLVNRIAAYIGRPIKFFSLTSSAGCVAFKD